ncbi:unnamed protein product [Closterium sp. Yama58-4]|nr:unnamed protein product [Closterium sp. Yama58-4]
MTSLRGSGGSGGDGGGNGGSGGGGRSGSRGGAVQWGVSGGRQMQLRRLPRVTLMSQQLNEWYAQRGASRSTARCPYVIRTGARAEFGDEAELPRWLELLREKVDFFALDYDAILTAMYALTAGTEGDCYLCVPPDPGIEAAALGACESALSGTAPAEALPTFTLDSVLARASTVLPCPAVPSGSLSGLHLPSFSTNLVSNAVLQDAGVDTFFPRGQRVAICTCSRTGRHLATFTRRPGSSLYILITAAAAYAQVSASSQVAASCSCRLLSHQTLLWHHRLGHPSLPRLRGMHSRLLVSGLPRSLPPLPPSPAPPCIPCVEGRQRAAPHSSSFPPTTAPLQTLHMDVWGPARVTGQGRERYFLLVVDDYSRYTTVFPLRSKGEVPDVLIPWIRTVRLQLRERFRTDLPVLRLHSDGGGEFSSDLLRDFCQGEGILQSFMLPASPQQNGIAERRIGLVMEVACTSMIHAAAPYFLWPFAVRYAAHQLNLWPRVSLPETSPTVLWTGKVGDASVFWVWGSRAFVRDTSADKLSYNTIPCVFLGFPPDAPGWQFYDPTLRRVLPSLHVTFDESVPFYRLFPYRSVPLPPPPLFLAPGPPPVDPLPPQGPAPSGVSQVDPLPLAEPVEVTGYSDAASEGAAFGGAEPEASESLSRPSSCASGLLGAPAFGVTVLELEAQELQALALEALELEALALEALELEALALEALELEVLELQTLKLEVLELGALELEALELEALTLEVLELEVLVVLGLLVLEALVLEALWSLSPHSSCASGTLGAPAFGDTLLELEALELEALGLEAMELEALALEVLELEALELEALALEALELEALELETLELEALALEALELEALELETLELEVLELEALELEALALEALELEALELETLELEALALEALELEALELETLELEELELEVLAREALELEALELETLELEALALEVLALEALELEALALEALELVALELELVALELEVLALETLKLERVPLPSPPASSLPDVPDPESDLVRAASPTVTRVLATVVTDPSFESTAAFALVAELVDFAATCRLDYATSLVAEQEDFECLAAAVPHLVAWLLALEGDPDALDIPTPRSYAEAILGPYFSQWQTAMDAEMASWKSTGTYVDAVPPPGANIVDGMWIFRVKRPPGSPPVFKARYVTRVFSQRQGVDFFHTFSPTPKMTTLRVLLHVAAQRDYELHSLDFSTAFLQGSLHEEIWLRRPPGFTGSFPPGTLWSLRRPVYGLRQAPHEWHDTLRTTLAAFRFAPSTADPSLFLRTDTSLPPFYIVVYVDDLVFATADIEALALVKSELQKGHT